MQLDGYKEMKKRGSPGFPIELYRLNRWHPRFQMSYHWHMECEILHVQQGHFLYELDGERGVAQAGDIVFINCGVLHAGTPQGEGCVYRCVVFDPAMLQKKGQPGFAALQQIADGTRFVRPHFTPNDTAVHRTCTALLECMADGSDGARMQVMGYLYQFFGEVLKAGHTTQKAGNSGSRRKIRQLKQVLALIDESYSQPLTLAQLAEAAGMTPKYFCQFFHEMTHQSPIDYVNAHRIEVACVLLAMPEHSVTDIAYECGFNDLSYFIRVFKKYKGVTPGQYVKQAQERETALAG